MPFPNAEELSSNLRKTYGTDGSCDMHTRYSTHEMVLKGKLMEKYQAL